MRASNQIFILLIAILFGVLSGGYLALAQLESLRDDAYAINNLGVIRGSIQLVSKRELNGTPSKTNIDKIDGIFREIEHRFFAKEANRGYVQQFNLSEQIGALRLKWIELKDLFNSPKNIPETRERIMLYSEACWELADQLVYQVQKISEIKLKNYQDAIALILLVTSIFILAIISMVYVMIRKRLELEVITDPLTGLYNRNYFNKILHDQVELFRRYGEHFTLTLLDIDFFKKVNDDFGHPQGDIVLITVANLIKENTRDVDFLFRMGGEEFAVISPHCNIEDAMKLAEKYQKLISNADFDLDRKITISIGVSESFGGCQEEDLYKNADKALYEAKSTGRNKALRFINDVQ